MLPKHTVVPFWFISP